MLKIDKETVVHAPLEKVEHYIADLNKWSEFCPNIIEISDVKPIPVGGHSAKFKYKIIGKIMSGKARVIDIAHSSWIVLKTEGGFNSIITWTFRSVTPDLTWVTYTVEFENPIKRQVKSSESTLTRTSELIAEGIFNNFRELVELNS